METGAIRFWKGRLKKVGLRVNQQVWNDITLSIDCYSYQVKE